MLSDCVHCKNDPYFYPKISLDLRVILISVSQTCEKQITVSHMFVTLISTNCIRLNHLPHSQTGRWFCVLQICHRYVKSDICIQTFCIFSIKIQLVFYSGRYRFLCAVYKIITKKIWTTKESSNIANLNHHLGNGIYWLKDRISNHPSIRRTWYSPLLVSNKKQRFDIIK